MAGTYKNNQSNELNISESSSKRRKMFHSQRADDYDNLFKMLKEGNVPDVTLVCNDGGEFRAHKIVLSAKSSYFRAMFCGSFRETTSDRVLLHSVDSRMMRIIMNYIDLEHKDYQSFEASIRPFVTDVLRVSHMLELSGLAQLSSSIIGEQISYDNYMEMWQLYDTCRTETLKEYLIATFRRYYRYFFYKKVYLTFDPPLMKFVFDQWTPYLDHKLMVKVLLKWVEAAPEQREDSFGELAQLLRKDRLPPGFMQHLSREEKLLQRHPEVLERFQSAEPTVTDSTQFQTKEEVLVDSLSVLVFRYDHTVERLYFTGHKVKKVLPLDLDLARADSRLHVCVEYKSKLYIIREIYDEPRIDFFEYDFDTNSTVSINSLPVPALRYQEAFVSQDRLYVHCPQDKFLQFYDFQTGGAWTRLDLPSFSTIATTLCPYENSCLILRQNDDGDDMEVIRLDQTSVFTIPGCKLYLTSIIVHCSGRLYGFSNHSDKNTQFVYDIENKCLKWKMAPLIKQRRKCHCPSFCDFQRISIFQRHPLILKYENNVCTLLDFQDGTELGKLRITKYFYVSTPYCNDVTL